MSEQISQEPTEGSCSLEQQYNPSSPEQIANPYSFHVQACKGGPIFFSSKIDAWVVASYEDAVSILKDHQHFAAFSTQTSFQMFTPQAQSLARTSPFWQVPTLRLVPDQDLNYTLGLPGFQRLLVEWD
jgi:hypothetical protein